MVGVPGIEPGLHAPHACVLPVYYTPESVLRALAFANAGRTRQNARSLTYAKPLEIWVFALPFYRIVVTAKKLALAAHH